MKKLKNLWIEYATELGVPFFIIGLVLAYGTFKYHDQFAASYKYGDVIYGTSAAVMIFIGIVAMLTSKFMTLESSTTNTEVEQLS